MNKNNMKKILLVGLIVVAVTSVLLLIPKPIGNDNPLNGMVQGCIGYTYKTPTNDGPFEAENNYYCVGIPYYIGPGF
jgi:hypothetical protein